MRPGLWDRRAYYVLNARFAFPKSMANTVSKTKMNRVGITVLKGAGLWRCHSRTQSNICPFYYFCTPTGCIFTRSISRHVDNGDIACVLHNQCPASTRGSAQPRGPRSVEERVHTKHTLKTSMRCSYMLRFLNCAQKVQCVDASAGCKPDQTSSAAASLECNPKQF